METLCEGNTKNGNLFVQVLLSVIPIRQEKPNRMEVYNTRRGSVTVIKSEK